MIKGVAAVLLVEDEELTIPGFERTNLKNPVDVVRDGQQALDSASPHDAALPLPDSGATAPMTSTLACASGTKPGA
jgi:hypothetical protein